ncbi:MAG TPA: tripartite tricarboxylate transporter substrate binding protein [Burkholderiales bacterium]|jgi:tripartite-type tricarboxylate transporter receptor subunit TctC|nr:tripartite tricarboxylate transporter substrate binding protein [Burkholderiales bacterium]
MRIHWWIACAAAQLGLAAYAQAQTAPSGSAHAYPSKPVRLIVGFAPGGGTDVAARAIVNELADGLKQRVIIDNRPGANGVVGTELAAKSPPDGYTLLMVNSGHTANPGLYPRLPYDSIRDFAPVSLVATLPNLLVIHPSLPVKDFPQFVRLARTRPGQINYGSGGQGASSHLGMELLKRATHTDLVHVVYKSGGQSATALLAGEVVVSFNTIPSALPYVKSGRLRALGVSSLTRSASVPDVPAIAEMGYPGFTASGMAGMLAPAGAPAEVVNRVHGEIVKLIKLSHVVERFTTLGLDPVGSTPADFGQFIKTDTERWTRLIRELKVTLE